ncbi:unnamed protein product [Heterobilharzia americana]|nr:unnamed protein product [Heterobilharzia americana]
MWNQSMKFLAVGRCRLSLPDWTHPCVHHNQWLRILSENRLKWRRCIHSLTFSKVSIFTLTVIFRLFILLHNFIYSDIILSLFTCFLFTTVK